MAERYQDRPYSAGGHGRGGDQFGSDRDESDPLAELARLIGQTDPFGAAGRAKAPVPPRATPRQGYQQGQQPGHQQEYRQDYHQGYQQDYEPAPEEQEEAPPPQWMQRANFRREPPKASREVLREQPRDFESENEDHLSAVHPLHRYPAQPHQPHRDTYYQEEPAYRNQPAYGEPEAEPQLDPSRYDDALYGQIESGLQDFQREPAYPDDPYAYQAGYDDEIEEPSRKRRGTMFIVAGVLALAVVGTAAAYGYRTYFTTARNGEPPIIKADNSPTKIVPAPSDGSAKLPDRLVSGDGTEKIVSREEQPVDVDARAAGPRVVFPPLNQNTNTPSAAGVSPSTGPTPAGAGPIVAPNNGTLPNSEPRKIKTFSVRGDQPDAAATPVNTPPPPAPPAAPKQTVAARSKALAQANASANTPMSLAPLAQSAPPAETRVAATGPVQTMPSASTGSGAFMVQVSSQRSEADAQASFRALQNKFPSVLGSQAPVIRRDDQGEKGIYFQAMVGPFGTREEAVQFCGNYKSAGGQCFVKKN